MQDPEAYITSDELFNSIKEDFYSYDNAGLIDEGQFYRHVTYILEMLGVEWYREESDFYKVEGNRLKLPDNFKLLDQAYRCDHQDTTNPIQPDGVVFTERRFDHFPVECNTEPCREPVPDNCILNQYQQLVVQRNTFVGRYSGFRLLKIGNKRTRAHCHGKCANLLAENLDSITIENKTMYTNFREGHVYIKYWAFPVDEETGLPLIPHNEKIMKCLEYYIKNKIIENLWVNGDADVAQKVQYFAQLYNTALKDAITETKLPTFNTMVNKIRLTRRRNDIFQLRTTPTFNY